MSNRSWRRGSQTMKRNRCRIRRSPRLQLDLLEDRRLLSADAVLDWNAVMLEAEKNDFELGHTPDQVGPTRASRAMAIVSIAMYDAVTAIDRTYIPYLADMHAAPKTSMNAAVATAAHDTLVAMFPHQSSTLDAELTTSLTGIAKGPAALGVELGRRVARAELAARAHDGADIALDYTCGDQPGQYRPDPLHPNQMALSPDWGGVTPFVMTSGSQFPAPPPPALTSQQYTDAFNQVKSLGGDGVSTPTTRTAEQTGIGIFWAYDGTPGLGTPPRLYNQITRVIAQQEHNTEVQNARLFAMVNVAMADAGIAAWATKFQYNFWRPITGIRESDLGNGPTGLGDGNPNTIGDPNWTPLGAPADNGSGTDFTPPFPAYTSGHATFGGAVFTTIRNFYGTDNIPFSFTSDEFNGETRDSAGNVRPVVTRSFSTLSQAAQENAESRIYLGIHWQFDADQGIAQGTQVANYVFGHFSAATLSQQVLMASESGKAALAISHVTTPATTTTSAAVDQALAYNDFSPCSSSADPIAVQGTRPLLQLVKTSRIWADLEKSLGTPKSSIEQAVLSKCLGTNLEF